MEDWNATRYGCYMLHETTAIDDAFSPTTARIDTLAEFMRGVILVDERSLLVNRKGEQIEFEA